jgi:hypothetical protein
MRILLDGPFAEEIFKFPEKDKKENLQLIIG